MFAYIARQFTKVFSAVGGWPTPVKGFKLTRYFVLTSLFAIAIVAPLMYWSEQSEEVFFKQVLSQQMVFFKNVQAEFVHEHETTTQNDVLRMNEASHVNLAHVFANTLWDGFISPVMDKAQSIPIAHCQALSSGGTEGPSLEKQSNAQRTCLAKVGQSIMSLPRFKELDSKVRATMRTSTVFKIKVFDLRGLTVYSSEQAQIGELKSDNQGWKTASGGQAASELTHRKRFSAFEGMVEDRDLISSYIPIFNASNKVLAVFEIYSDATPFLKAMQESSIRLSRRTANNQAAVEAVASNNLDRLNSNNSYSQLMGGSLLALFYVLLLLIVRNGQRILDQQTFEQTSERAKTNERERLWHREKMAALATMAANVAHETGNPLATISAIAEDMVSQKAKLGCAICEPKTILEQTERIVSMTRKIVDFSAVRSESFEPVDVNQMVGSVCDFLSFDHRFRGIQFELNLCPGLTACNVIPDYFTEALMYLMQQGLEECLRARGAVRRILVETKEVEGEVRIRISRGATSPQQATSISSAPADSRYEFALSRITEIGGRLASTSERIEVCLKPLPQHVVKV